MGGSWLSKLWAGIKEQVEAALKAGTLHAIQEAKISELILEKVPSVSAEDAEVIEALVKAKVEEIIEKAQL